MSRDHRNLVAFQLADALAVKIYARTKSYPREELFGLTSQMRRAAVSVTANIVEGCARIGEREFSHALNMAFGSLRELGYFIDLSARLGYLTASEATALSAQYNEAARVLSGLLLSVQRFANKGKPSASSPWLKTQDPSLKT